MRSDWFYIVNIALPLVCLLANWLSYKLLRRYFPALNSAGFRRLFLSASLLGLAAVLYARFSFRLNGEPGFTWFVPGVYLAIGWNLSQWIALLLFLPGWLLSFLFFQRQANKQPVDSPVSSSRRRLITGMFSLPPLLGSGVAATGLLNGSAEPVINRRRLPYPDLPPELAGFTLVQISDIHLGPFFGPDKLDRLLQRAAAERPDLLLVTGDLVDDLGLLPAALKKFDRLRQECRCGLYFCLGNHEYFRNIDQVRRLLDASALVTLTDSHQLLLPGSRPLYLLGVDYPATRSPAERRILCRRSFNQAAAGIPPGAFTILMAHHPDFITDGFDRGIDLTVAGHTHGGQVGLLGQPLLPFGFTYQRGLYRQNNSFSYVNVGAGHWLPFRLGCPAELAVLTLVPG